MDKILIIVSAVVGSLGLLSAIFGFSAEGTKLTPYTILTLGDECIYPQNPALGLGVCAIIFLLAGQVTFTAVGGCCGCCKSRPNSSETKRIVGIVCAAFSWVAAVIAWVLLVEGAAWNANVVRVVSTAPFCPYLKDGIFAGAAVLCLVATGLGITSYAMTRTRRPRVAAPPAAAEGEPKLPPAATQGNNGSPQDQDPPADTAPPAMASAPPEPAAEPTPPPGAEMGQPPVHLPQVGVPNDTAVQFPMQATHVGVEAPISRPTATASQQGSEQLIRNELTKAGIRLAERAVEHALFLS